MYILWPIFIRVGAWRCVICCLGPGAWFIMTVYHAFAVLAWFADTWHAALICCDRCDILVSTTVMISALMTFSISKKSAWVAELGGWVCCGACWSCSWNRLSWCCDLPWFCILLHVPVWSLGWPLLLLVVLLVPAKCLNLQSRVRHSPSAKDCWHIFGSKFLQALSLLHPWDPRVPCRTNLRQAFGCCLGQSLPDMP